MFLVIIGWPIAFYYSHFPYLTVEHHRWAEFGDFLGGVLNPILAAGSLLAFFVTMYAQHRETVKNESNRKVNEITNALQLLERTMDPKVEQILSRQYTLPKKDEYNYRLAESLVSDLRLCDKFLSSLGTIAETSTTAEYYRQKYIAIVSILHEKEYIKENLKNFYAVQE